jgi:hypothetical protein
MSSPNMQVRSETVRPLRPVLKRPHEYLRPLKEQYSYCKKCARRMTTCIRCSYCYLCHPFKEAEEEAEYLRQSKISQFIQD